MKTHSFLPIHTSDFFRLTLRFILWMFLYSVLSFCLIFPIILYFFANEQIKCFDSFCIWNIFNKNNWIINEMHLLRNHCALDTLFMWRSHILCSLWNRMCAYTVVSLALIRLVHYFLFLSMSVLCVFPYLAAFFPFLSVHVFVFAVPQTQFHSNSWRLTKFFEPPVRGTIMFRIMPLKLYQKHNSLLSLPK